MNTICKNRYLSTPSGLAMRALDNAEAHAEEHEGESGSTRFYTRLGEVADVMGYALSKCSL